MNPATNTPTPEKPAYKSQASKLPIAIVIIAVVLMIYIFPFGQTEDPKPVKVLPTVRPSIPQSNVRTQTIQGTVRSNETKNLPIDGAGVLKIESPQGIFDVIYHPGDAECTNKSALDYGLTIKEGDRVEIYGENEEFTMYTCPSASYYISKTFCGDAICQEITCTSVGCPKPETAANCPQDCHKSSDIIYKISDLKKKLFIGEVYKVKGYVVKKYSCPVCPDNSQCKPCIENNIVIGETAETIFSHKTSNNNLILLTKKSENLEIEKLYIFTIKVKNSYSVGDSVPDLELLTYYLYL